MERDRLVEQARGLGYVHFERVGARTFACAFDTGSDSSFLFRALGTSARVDCRWRIGPGVRALRALFSLPLSVSSVLQCYVYLASQCALVVCFFLVTTLLFFLSFFLVGSVFSIVIPFRFRIAGPSGAGLPTGLTLEGIMMALCGVVVGVVYDKIILPPLQCGGGVRLLSGPPNVIDTVEDSKLICGPLLLPLLTVVVLVAF